MRYPYAGNDVDEDSDYCSGSIARSLVRPNSSRTSTSNTIKFIAANSPQQKQQPLRIHRRALRRRQKQTRQRRGAKPIPRRVMHRRVYTATRRLQMRHTIARAKERLALKNAKKTIVTVGDVTLSNEEVLLARGLTFILTEPIPRRQRLLREFERFARSMRIRYRMEIRNGSNTSAAPSSSSSSSSSSASFPRQRRRHPYAPRSTWNPTSSGNERLDEFIENVRGSLRAMPIRRPHFNLSLAERAALNRLAKRSDIIIKKRIRGRVSSSNRSTIISHVAGVTWKTKRRTFPCV